MRQIRNGAVALALMGGLAACSDDQASPDAVADEDKQTTSVAPARDCEAVAYDRSLAPGCWAIQVRGLPDSPLAELDLPAGFTGNDAWVWVQRRHGRRVGCHHPPAGRRRVPRPVRPRRKPAEGRPLGGGLRKGTDRAEGDHHDDARSRCRWTVTTGLYLEVSVPAGFDLSACRGKELRLWETEARSPQVLDASFVSRYWVLDVDGQRVVLVVNTNTSATDETVDRFTGIAEAATFDEG